MGIVGLGRIREGLCRVLKSIHCIIVCMYTGKPMQNVDKSVALFDSSYGWSENETFG